MASMEPATAPAKICTVCGERLVDQKGAPVTQLYDLALQDKAGIIKLVSCQSCDSVADKYLEFDGTLLCLDLVLQNPAALRHVLYNSDRTKLVLKMALLTVICDGYIRWNEIARPGEFFEQEYQFYIMCCKAVLSLLGFLAATLIPGFVLARKSQANKKSLALGMLMAYSSRFCNLFALLWSTNGFERNMAWSRVPRVVAAGAGCGLWPHQGYYRGDHVPAFSQPTSEDSSIALMWVFIYLLFYVSSVSVYQVTLKISRWKSVILTTIGHLVFACLLNLDFILPD